MAEDIIEIEILDDGTIKSTTNVVSPANHSSADRFFKLMAELAGGDVERQRRSHKHTHVHEHSHEEAKH
jgi:catabolite regulation protein CreA